MSHVQILAHLLVDAVLTEQQRGKQNRLAVAEHALRREHKIRPLDVTPLAFQRETART